MLSKKNRFPIGSHKVYNYLFFKNGTSYQAVETLFSQLAARLAAEGVTRFIVAGGETSGVVTQSLGIKGFHIGPTISPGVPWVNALDKPVSLALKSGNFGDEAFFSRAQREFLS